MTEEDYSAAAYEEELAMEEEARAATNEVPAAAPMDAEPAAEADKPKGVFDWRERDDFGKRLVPEESRAKTVHDRRKEHKLQAPGACSFCSLRRSWTVFARLSSGTKRLPKSSLSLQSKTPLGLSASAGSAVSIGAAAGASACRASSSMASSSS